MGLDKELLPNISCNALPYTILANERAAFIQSYRGDLGHNLGSINLLNICSVADEQFW